METTMETTNLMMMVVMMMTMVMIMIMIIMQMMLMMLMMVPMTIVAAMLILRVIRIAINIITNTIETSTRPFMTIFVMTVGFHIHTLSIAAKATINKVSSKGSCRRDKGHRSSNGSNTKSWQRWW